MLRAALLLDIIAIVIALSEFSAKIHLSELIGQIPIPAYQIRASQEFATIAITSGLSLIPICMIIYLWTRGNLFENTSSLHWWNLIAAFTSLLGKKVITGKC